MSTETIYVRLLDEGVDVWRPAQAERVTEDLYRLLGPAPEDEQWEFEPGAVVRVSQKRFHGSDQQLVAVGP